MRITPCTTLLPLLLTLAACTPAAAPADAQASADAPAVSVAPAAVASPPACEDADFAAFLFRFANDPSVQRASTANPLVMEFIDSNAQPEPRRVSKQVPLLEVEFPVFFDATRREAEGLQETVIELSPTERQVTHGIPDSDAQIRFSFRAAPCWKLVRVSNDMI